MEVLWLHLKRLFRLINVLQVAVLVKGIITYGQYISLNDVLSIKFKYTTNIASIKLQQLQLTCGSFQALIGVIVFEKIA